ncbi:MAG TPA: hypothetical protein PK959_06490 [Candidatus Competibacteraceae bacterium]|nr:hypothetical protein [Candidatus Competibacteraceae bacterium]
MNNSHLTKTQVDVNLPAGILPDYHNFIRGKCAFTPDPRDEFFYCQVSAFRDYAPEYMEALADYLMAVTDDAVCVAWEPDEDALDDGDEWVMDCQDYYDVELLLDVTGNLDAPP